MNPPNDQEQSKPKNYRVTLKSGLTAVFTNHNNFDDYPDRLMSGIYGIVTRTGNEPINSETVLSIQEVEEKNDPNIAEA